MILCRAGASVLSFGLERSDELLRILNTRMQAFVQVWWTFGGMLFSIKEGAHHDGLAQVFNLFCFKESAREKTPD